MDSLKDQIKVVILCGGQGTRLREETEFRPKPMVNIGNRPILWHIMKYYACYGHNRFVLALGYRGDMIKNYFCHYELMNNDVTLELGNHEKMIIHQNHQEAGWEITLSDTGDKALKGARLKKISRYIKDQTFMMTYGDGLADVDLDQLLRFHREHGKLVTVTGINPASRFGELKIRGDHVQSFSEKEPDGNRFVNGGYFIFNRNIFDYLTEDDTCDLEIGPLEQLAREGQLMVYRHGGFWACMDTLRDVEYLNKIWSDNNATWKKW